MGDKCINQAAEIAIQVSRSRETLKKLYGDRYREVIAPMVEALMMIMNTQKKTPTEAAFVLLERTKDNHQSGVLALHICAAAAEVIEAQSP